MKNKFTLAVLLLAAQIALAQIPSNGLVAYFPFNGNANDQSGNGNNGTPSSGYIYANTPPVLTADRNSVANSAYDFQPGVLSSAYIDLGTPAAFNFDSTTSFSISLWMKYTVYQVSASMFGNDQWHLAIRNLGGNDHLNLVVGSTSFNSDALLTPGAWVHVAGVYNRANKTMEIYINGTLATGFSYNGMGPYGPQGQASQNTADCAVCVLNSMPAGNTQIGLIGGTISTNIKGSIDDILFYNRALSGSEIGGIYTATGGPTRVEEINSSPAFSIVPNVGNGMFHLLFANAISSTTGIKVYNLMGQLVMQQNNITENQLLDLSQLQNGNYFVKLETETGSYTQKLSIVK